MALSDRWTQDQLVAAVRRELTDPAARWWSDAELNGYVEEWQRTLQNEFEFAWGTATQTTSLSTLTLSTVASDMLRLDAIYCNQRRLVARDKQELDGSRPDWRNTDPGLPLVAYQNDYHTVSFWPPNGTTTRTFVFEYPKTVSFPASTNTMLVPAWTKYSVVPYGAWQAFARFGPNHDINRAGRHRNRWRRAIERLRTVWANHFPDNYMSLRPGGEYEGDILEPTNQRNIP